MWEMWCANKDSYNGNGAGGSIIVNFSKSVPCNKDSSENNLTPPPLLPSTSTSGLGSKTKSQMDTHQKNKEKTFSSAIK